MCFFLFFLSEAVITAHSHGSLLLSAGLISHRMNRNCQSEAALSSETRGDWLLLLCCVTHTHTHTLIHTYLLPLSLQCFHPLCLHWCTTKTLQKADDFFFYKTTFNFSEDCSYFDFSLLGILGHICVSHCQTVYSINTNNCRVVLSVSMLLLYAAKQCWCEGGRSLQQLTHLGLFSAAWCKN